MPKHIARITLTRVGAFPQELEVSEGTTIAIGDGIATVKKISAKGVDISFEHPGTDLVGHPLGQGDSFQLIADKAPIATLALISITTQEETP